MKLLLVGSLGWMGSRILEDAHIHDIIRVITGTLLESTSPGEDEVQLLAVRFLKIVTSESKSDKRSRRTLVDGTAPSTDAEKKGHEDDIVQQNLRRMLAVHLSSRYPELMDVLLELVNHNIDAMSGSTSASLGKPGKPYSLHTPHLNTFRITRHFTPLCYRPIFHSTLCFAAELLRHWVKGSLEVAAPLFDEEDIRKATSVADLFENQAHYLHSVLNLALAISQAKTEPSPRQMPAASTVKRESTSSPVPKSLTMDTPLRKEGEVGKRSKWVRALCRICYSFGNDPSTRKYTKRLLTAICGSDEARYLACDTFMYKQEFSRLASLSKSFLEMTQVKYKVCVDTHGSLLRVLLAAKKRPSSWVAFLYHHPKKLELLLQLCASLDASGSEILPILLHLLALLAEDTALDTPPPPLASAPATNALSRTSSVSSAGGNVLGFLRNSSSEPDSPASSQSPAGMPSPATSIPAPSPSPPLSALKWQPAVATFMRNEAGLTAFVQTHLLQPAHAELRDHARSFLFFIWRVGSTEDQVMLVDHLIRWTTFLPRSCDFHLFNFFVFQNLFHLQTRNALPRFGSHAQQFLELVSVMLTDAHEGRGAMTAIQGARLVRGLLDAMHLQHRASQLDDDNLYSMVATLAASDADGSTEGSSATSPHEGDVALGTEPDTAIPIALAATEVGSKDHTLEAKPYYLSTRPCAVCCTPEQPFKLMKLKDIEAETKYTFCSKSIKFKERQAVRSISLRLGDLHPSKQVKSLEVYFNATPLGDLSEVKDNWEVRTLLYSPFRTS
jgi:hypothetical protein